MKRTLLAATAGIAVAVATLGVAAPANAVDASDWQGVYVSQNAIKTNSGNGYMLMVEEVLNVVSPSGKTHAFDIMSGAAGWVATPSAVAKTSLAVEGAHAVVGPIPFLKDKSKAITVKRLGNGNLQIIDCIGVVPKVTKANAKDMCLLVKVTQADLDKLN